MDSFQEGEVIPNELYRALLVLRPLLVKSASICRRSDSKRRRESWRLRYASRYAPVPCRHSLELGSEEVAEAVRALIEKWKREYSSEADEAEKKKQLEALFAESYRQRMKGIELYMQRISNVRTQEGPPRKYWIL